MKFEEALAALERSVADLKKESVSLEDAMQSYERGMEYHRQCEEILSQARQKIQLWDEYHDKME